MVFLSVEAVIVSGAATVAAAVATTIAATAADADIFPCLQS